MDNFVILAKTNKKLEERMMGFLRIAEKLNLCFKQLECDFNMKKIYILVVVVEQGEIHMENNKIKVVKEWKTPTKIKEVESFLGFANFYWQFIKNFSYTAKSLNELKEKKEWEWEEEHRRAFNKLKDKITS